MADKPTSPPPPPPEPVRPSPMQGETRGLEQPPQTKETSVKGRRATVTPRDYADAGPGEPGEDCSSSSTARVARASAQTTAVRRGWRVKAHQSGLVSPLSRRHIGWGGRSRSISVAALLSRSRTGGAIFKS